MIKRIPHTGNLIRSLEVVGRLGVAIVVGYWALFGIAFGMPALTGWVMGWILARQATATGMEGFLLSISPHHAGRGLGVVGVAICHPLYRRCPDLLNQPASNPAP